LFHRQTGLADDCAECAFGDVTMVGNYQSPMRRIMMAQNYVTAVLPIKFVTHHPKDIDNLTA
jgi:hypothetical protein